MSFSNLLLPFRREVIRSNIWQWQYFKPVQEGMPQNCSLDVSRVVDFIDEVNKNGTDRQRQHLKEMFGLGDLEYFDDFAKYFHPFLSQFGIASNAYSDTQCAGKRTLAVARELFLHRLLRILPIL